ncbi:MAG: FtsK/SpoIIIE domain-containing protein [Desulfobacterium sp.]|nr:FtsK/SpoIIIE domain-containing protein [Desulfobacterium sp.]
MKSFELIGSTVVAYLKEKLSDQDEDGTARFLIDCLSAKQTAAIAIEILKDKELDRLIEIKLPISFVGEHGLPDNILTRERTTYFRNFDCKKSALLIANIGDDEQQSLQEIEPIGREQLFERIDLWIEVISKGLPLLPDQLNWWNKSLLGLLDVKHISLERFAEYLISTKEAIEDGHPLLNALGIALPELHLPKDSHFFDGLTGRNAGHRQKWKTLFNHAIKKRSSYLLKQTPNQGLITEETLVQAFEKTKQAIPEEYHDDIKNFISESSGWNTAAKTLANIEWEFIRTLFLGLKKETFNLGKATLDFYDEGEQDLISDDDQDYLKRLIKRKTNREPQEEDENFYHNHNLEFKSNLSLKTKWDRFVYGAPIECEDFLVGISMCLESLFGHEEPIKKQQLIIRCDKRTKGDLKKLNNEAGRFFAFRYMGLKSLFGNKVIWDIGNLFDYSKLDKEWKKTKKVKINRSVAKAALTIKFFLELEVESVNGNISTISKQLIWKFNPNAVPSELHDDWTRLGKNPLVLCNANRSPLSGKGLFQSLNLENVQSLVPSFGKDKGSFVSTYAKENDINLIWSKNLETSLNLNLIDTKTAEQLEHLYESFKNSYTNAIISFIEYGVSIENLSQQANDYEKLIDHVCQNAKGDKNRELLLRPLLQIGIVPVEGGRVASIVAPWHPLRLLAMANKSLQLSALLKYLLSSQEINFGDPHLFFKELKNELSHPYYPEIVVGWHENNKKLLSLTDSYLDYSLHESPIINNTSSDDTNENPTKSSNLILDLIKQFLKLYPHEKSNLSLVLYNSDSSRLPQSIVSKINDFHNDDADMRCEIILRHRDGEKLRALYEEIIKASDDDPDSFIASEVTKDFMARLRIGIMVDQAPIPDPKDGPPADMVFLQDVIARHAEIGWYKENAKPISENNFIPARWSRRRPSVTDDMKSVVYLCCPVQNSIGWTFISALTTFFKGDWDGNKETRLLPARQLDFNDNETAAIFKEIHNLGNWVINYDELLDRRQLINQDVNVIRYKQFATQGRNMIISSKAPLGLLRSMILSRIKSLSLEIPEQNHMALAEKFLNDAMEISGDIVLRAAKRGRSASELMGVVLSQYLIKHELGDKKYLGWYFLDDYAEWLGQREQQIADLLALSPEKTSDGKMRLVVIVSESKYIDFNSLSQKRKESQKQLRDTMKRIGDAIFGNPKRLDRDLWLSRFSDLILNGIQFPASSEIDLSSWRRAIREGKCDIYLRGYSHVFISGPTDSSDCSELVEVADLENSFQEIFSRQDLRHLIVKYSNETDPMPVRKGISDQNIWKHHKYFSLSHQVNVLNEIEKKQNYLPKTEQDSIEIVAKHNAPKEIPQTIVPNPPKEGKSKNTFYNSVFNPSINDQGPINGNNEAEKEWLKQTVSRCKGALQQFQLRSKLLSESLTPNAALLKFQGSSNLKVEDILKRQSELLTTHGLNIISVKGEPGIIAISIARPDRKILHLLQVWQQWKPNIKNGNDEIIIGVKEDDSKLLFFSPKKNSPHTLIAGSTGSGKSVLMQNIILAIACTNTPEQSKITLIDPKLGVDYFPFEGLPHLQGGVIDEQEKAIDALSKLTIEMDRRYGVLKQNRASNIYDLNKKEAATEHLPFLWIIHDEFAEWMMTDDYSKEVSNIVARLGVKARAAGIFLIFAAQRPDHRVMPIQLRSNLGNRLILRVDAEGTSNIATGEKGAGAEKLLGKGHLIAKLEGEEKIITAQVPFIKSDEIEEIVNRLIKDYNNKHKPTM